jgi:hypothetical protein
MLQPYAMVLWMALAVGSGYGVSKMLFDRMAAQQGTMPGAAGV